MSGTVGDNAARASGVIASPAGGTILAVKSLVRTDAWSKTGTTPAHLSEWDISYAMTESDSKLLFTFAFVIGTGGTQTAAFYLYNNTSSTIVSPIGDSSGSRLQLSWAQAAMNHTKDSAFYDCWVSPATTTSQDYRVYGAVSESNTLYFNRSHDDSNNSTIDNSRSASSLTITEYAGDKVTLT